MSEKSSPNVTKNSKLTPKNFRLPNHTINLLKNTCEAIQVTETFFVRQAIEEKALRQSIEQNLDVKVDTRRVEKLVTDSFEKLEKMVTRITNRQDALEQRVNLKLDQVMNFLTQVTNGILELVDFIGMPAIPAIDI